MTVLGVIPARGGSKGLPRKNLAMLGGRPLIAWTIDAARASRGLSRVVVSTEDAEIAEVARACGADVPFSRPRELATDAASGTAPTVHALQWFETHEGFTPDLAFCLQPTSPFRTSDDIDAAIDLLVSRQATSVVGVQEADPHPYWTVHESDSGWMQPMIGDTIVTRRQALPVAYSLNGAVYLATRALLLEQDTFYGPRTALYVMPAERSLDIDTAWDLQVANAILDVRRTTADGPGPARS